MRCRRTALSRPSCSYLLPYQQGSKTLINGPVELILFLRKNLENHRSSLPVRITILERSITVRDRAAKNFALDAKFFAMACCTAQKAAQNISASLVGWHNAIGNHEGARLDMIRYNTQEKYRSHDLSDIRYVPAREHGLTELCWYQP